MQKIKIKNVLGLAMFLLLSCTDQSTKNDNKAPRAISESDRSRYNLEEKDNLLYGTIDSVARDSMRKDSIRKARGHSDK
ncbi:hypothetical protein [Sphingobacterium psychroaquaticum]|uniref:Uncharacterized protein n=1 Tax=Sphingobacterium psychroaquaticum TaxID=561061 RepID=A0A1X7JMD3_9SPHI|nr:hypothetical protein [Sphingobacterium psychroaquaticum]SMG29028.1 hypothetical protein SAMN05660862_1867 [Sphingobacterium psychroaquaticum]